ncbi:hypothetical protein MLPM_1523 [Mycobacterium lepromatosis]|uniref:Uncharacterized protein n=1 Tax=Mycobacterium lepromatosis TaxID=480418 RepID=A0A0F4EQ66_9MYCO|nr:hypothetical protein MLPM_1523 [Mycobacterium lepromatosis]
MTCFTNEEHGSAFLTTQPGELAAPAAVPYVGSGLRRRRLRFAFQSRSCCCCPQSPPPGLSVGTK